MLIFYLLLIPTKSDDEECTLKSYSRTIRLVGMSYESIKEFTAKITEGSTTFPVDLNSDELNEYFKVSVGFIAPVTAMFIVLALYFFIGEIFTCCKCCRSKYSKPPSILQTIIHLIFAVLFGIGVVILLISATKITVGVVNSCNSVIDIPNDIDDIFKRVYDKLYFALQSVENSVSDINSSVYTLSEVISNIGTSVNEQISSIFYSLGLVEGNLTNLRDKTEAFNSALKDCNSTSVQINLTEIVDQGIEKVKLMNSSISILQTNTLQELSYIIGNTSEKLSSSVVSIVSDLRDVKIPDLIQPFTTVVSEFSEMSENTRPQITKIRDLSSYVSFIVCIILFIVLITYIIFYFCNNCCSRSLLANFWIVGFIINLVIGAVSIAFAILFALLYDICPSLGPIINNIGSEFITTRENLYDILICSSNLSDPNLLYQLNIDFDYNSQLSDVQDMLNSSLSVFDLGYIIDNLTQLLIFQPTKNLTLENIFPYDLDEIERISNCESANEALDDVKEGKNELEVSLQEAKEVTSDFAYLTENLAPSLSTAQSDVAFLTVDMVNVLGNNINATVSELSCNLVCPIYTSIENSICSTVLDGIALWVVSFYCLIIALFGLSITLCIRRRSMGPLEVKDQFIEE